MPPCSFLTFGIPHCPAEGLADSHLIERGSSVDIIERCAAFLRQCSDFEGLLDYAEDENIPGKYQEMLHSLEKEAMRIIAKESH